VTKITGAFLPKDGKKMLNYKRVVPERFSTNKDDWLMNSIITDYALEGNTGGAPNGHFYMTKDAMYAISEEVTKTHLGMDGAKLDQWVDEKVTELWPRYDTNLEGFIDAERAPIFLRQVLGENEISRGLQLQTKQSLHHHKHHLNSLA